MGMITRSDLLRNREEDQTALRLPVVDGKNLVGIITVADIVREAADMNIQTAIEEYFEKDILVLRSEMPVPIAGAIMEYAQV